MKEFLATFAIILVLLFVFFLFGGYILFDFSRNFWIATVSCAFMLSVIVTYFVKLSDRVDALEKRLDEIAEEKKDA